MERSVPALLGLARVSGLGMGTAWVFILYQKERKKENRQPKGGIVSKKERKKTDNPLRWASKNYFLTRRAEILLRQLAKVLLRALLWTGSRCPLCSNSLTVEYQ